MSLTDKFLPSYQFSERHQTMVRCAGPGELLDIIQRFRPPRNRLSDAAMFLRQLPAWLAHWLAPSRVARPKPFTPANFIPLWRDDDREIVAGLVGKLWRQDFGLIPIPGPVEFLACHPAGAVKLVIGFLAEQTAEGIRLTTETRAFCPDRYSLLMFTPYWFAIRPVSGLLRRRALRDIRRIAENNDGGAALRPV
jgi:hypothetical protein